MPPTVDALEQARQARQHTREGFLHAVDLGQEMRREVEQLAEHGRRNHFGEDLSWLWRKGST